MNTKIAKVIAFELGLIIAILTWLALPTLRESEPRRTTQVRTPSDSFGTVSPLFKPRASRLYAANNSAGQTTTDLLDDGAAQAEAGDEQPTVTQRQVDSYRPNTYVIEESTPYDDNATPSYYYDNTTPYYENTSPYYENTTPYLGNAVPILPEPVLDPSYYVDPYYQYQQPVQVIIVSNSHSNHRSRAISTGRGRLGCSMVAQRSPIRQPHMRPRGGNGSPVLVSNPPRQLPRGGVIAPMPAPRGRVIAHMPMPRGGVIAGRPTTAGRPTMLTQTSRPTQVRRARWSP